MTDIHSQSDQSACDHDWRVDPTEMLLSSPPQERLVCASCGAVSSRFISVPKPQPYSTDPKDWPKA